VLDIIEKIIEKEGPKRSKELTGIMYERRMMSRSRAPSTFAVGKMLDGDDRFRIIGRARGDNANLWGLSDETKQVKNTNVSKMPKRV
jgi:hypothetical protein